MIKRFREGRVVRVELTGRKKVRPRNLAKTHVCKCLYHSPITALSQTHHSPITDLSQTYHRLITDPSQTHHRTITPLLKSYHSLITHLSHTYHRPTTHLAQTYHRPSLLLEHTSFYSKYLFIFIHLQTSHQKFSTLLGRRPIY